jgi:hypothetical protein
MQAPVEMLSDYHCKDKFLVQSVAVGYGATMRDFVPELVSSCSNLHGYLISLAGAYQNLELMVLWFLVY